MQCTDRADISIHAVLSKRLMMSPQVAKRGARTRTVFLNNNVPAFCLAFRDVLQSIYINIQLYDECISKFKEDKQNQRV